MRIGRRLFPYPVINNDKTVSEFNDESVFELKLDLINGNIITDRNDVILKNICFSLNDHDLMDLYTQDKIGCCLIVESASSIFRHKFNLTTVPQTIRISKNELKDDVYVSTYCYAKEDIKEYSSSGFHDDYAGYKFDIEKYDILAADDGIRFSIDRNLDEDNKVSSIFTIVKDESANKLISTQMDKDKIKIYLPVKDYDNYETLKSNNEFHDIFFAFLIIPVLTSCFSNIKLDSEGYSDINDIIDSYRWFKSICSSYEKEKKEPLTIDNFKETNSFELAQIVFNYATELGMEKFCDIAIKGINEEGEEDTNG